MLRIGFQGPELERIAVQMLLVLTCARRPLSPQELSHALSIDESSKGFDEDMVPDTDDLVAACAGLVILDDTSNIVHLVHKSAAEYFERTRSRWFPRANEKMAYICLKYVQIVEAGSEETRGEEAPFFHYAKANWSYHSMEGEKEAAKEAVMSADLQTILATDYSMSPNTHAITQLAIHQMTKEVVDVNSSIVEACRAGHQAWVEQLLVVRNYDPNTGGYSQRAFISSDGTLKTPLPSRGVFGNNGLLTIATARGDCSMAQMLLARGADPNIFNIEGQTPLLIATTNGFDNLVSLLLDHRLTKPDLMCQYLGRLSTAFLVSIELGREGCFRMLLERSNLKARDGLKRGAMWLAAASGNTGIISKLLKWSDVEIDYTDTDCCGSPLTAAAKGGHEAAALLLLPYSKCRSCIYCGATPMHYAVRNGFHNLLKRLLEDDTSAVDCELQIHPYQSDAQRRPFPIDCEQKDIERVRTPLITAISLQDAQATQLLLPHANPNQGLNTWRPLHGVAEWGNTEIFELLLKKEGVDLDPTDEHGQTPFLTAAQYGNYDIMKALIQKGGIRLDIANEYGKTPFLLVAKRGNCDMMNTLIKLGDIQLDGRDALGYVADHYFNNHFPDIHVNCFHILASILDIDVNQKDPAGSTFLHRACSVRPKISIMEDTETRIFEAEMLETNSGHLVTELLKRPGIDVNLLDEKGNTPLLLAVKNHQRDVVRLLLEREGTDVSIQNEDGNDALSLASLYKPVFKPDASSMKAEIRPLTGQVPTRYRDHWPEDLNAEFKEYDETIFSMLLHDKRIDLTTLLNEQHTYLTAFVHDNLYPYWDTCRSVIGRVVIRGTKSMVQAVLEVTELASKLEILSSRGRSLISYALEENEDDEAVELLIAHCSSAVLQKANAYGRTPLSFAVKRATSLATQALLKAGVNTNAADEDAETPLSSAAKEGHPDTARLLLAADETLLNIPDCKGITPLMHASGDLNIPVMSVFLERPSADLLALDGEGHSFLCHLMMPRYRDSDGYGSEKELDDVIHRIHRLLQPRVGAIKGHFHSPFLCALDRDERNNPRPYYLRRIFPDICEVIARHMNNLQRFTILSDFFHPGLDFSRCATIAGLLEMFGEQKHDVDHNAYDRRDLCMRALRLYVDEDLVAIVRGIEESNENWGLEYPIDF